VKKKGFFPGKVREKARKGRKKTNEVKESELSRGGKRKRERSPPVKNPISG